MRRQHILLLLVALIAVLPLFVFGCSCGHDFDFHIQSWLEAKRQLLHGTLRPHWVFSAAYNAGEPRFVFYPPLSWTLGELLALFVPVTQLPAIYTLVVFALAGQTMYLLAREFVEENAAAVGAALYIVNPYMLFTAYERSAFAELLAAAWMPLLLRAVWKKRPTVVGLAIPLALLWLTNAPAAVIGSYTLALLMAVRVFTAWRKGDRTEARRHALVAASGAVLGLALTAFYLVPAAYERRFVQIAMAVIVNMRVQDNFLFERTGDADHDGVLRTASWIAVAVLGAAAALLAAWFARSRSSEPGADDTTSTRQLATRLLMLVAGIALLLTPLSAIVWRHVPELTFLQFPWRLLTVAAVALGLAAALAKASFPVGFLSLSLAMAAGVIALTAFGSHQFRQGCEAGDYPSAISGAMNDDLGFAPTDEYTPGQADNDALHPATPAYWVANSAQAPAPKTNPGHSLARWTPAAFELHTSVPGLVVLNLRDYPNWMVTLTDSHSNHGFVPTHIPRTDGLLALQVPAAGDYRIDIRWRRSPDEWAGMALSTVAAAVCGWLLWAGRSRRINS